MTEDQKSQLIQNYELAARAYQEAQKALEVSVRALHRVGVFPSPVPALRYHLADERDGMTHKFEIGHGDGGMKGYVTTGVYSDGKVGELFVVAEKEGTFVSGLLDEFATLFSIALQSGVPLGSLISKFKHDRFEPAGMTSNPQIRTTTSVVDYLMHWLELRYPEQSGGAV